MDSALSSRPIWQPTKERIANSNMQDFMQQAAQLAAQQDSASPKLDNYKQLHQWSLDHNELFWSLVWQYHQLVPALPEPLTDSAQLKAVRNDGADFWQTRWFQETKINFAENLLKACKEPGADKKLALITCGEPGFNQGQDKTLSYQQLYLQVAKVAHAFKAMGLTAGDRVAAFMPNTQETLVAMLAASSLGAVWSSCSPDFGIQGVIDRFGQIEAKVLLTTEGYFYGGKTLDSIPKVQKICQQLNSIEQLIIIPHSHDEAYSERLVEQFPEHNERLDLSVSSWAQLMNNSCEEIDFQRFDFDHPLYIMYSSGTTGVPKCIVHSAGGTLIQQVKELSLHTDVKAEDTIFYYSTCGWMMWNWLVAGLSLGATLVLYDGSPFYPDGHRLWQMAEKHNVSIFGTSAKYLSALEKAGIQPKQDYELKSLKTLLSTGSPLSHESFDYVYRDIKSDICLSSISGGTDIISCFALGNPILPVYRGQLQSLGLGMAVKVFNDQGRAIEQQKGELVCDQPFPSCPIGFWQDPTGDKFFNAYFSRFNNTWAHGDYAELTSQQGLIIHGRSDAVLNPGGVRIGTAEIYRQVEQLDEVIESIAVGQRWQQDVRIILFVILQPEITLDEALSHKICQQIKQHTTPRHVPAKVIQVADIPRTISGKIVELAVHKVIHNEVVNNTDALKNPEALDLYKNLPDLQV
jgi:acetoacetyl-CoA synthetase